MNGSIPDIDGLEPSSPRLYLCLKKSRTPSKMRDMTPPTTPPTIAAMLGFCLVGEFGSFEVEERAVNLT
jgi:hypothetical protein